MEEDTGLPNQDADQQPPTVDFTGTEENPVIINRQIQDYSPDGEIPAELGAMTSQTHDIVPGTVLRPVQPQQPALDPSGILAPTQMIPVPGAVMQGAQSHELSVHSGGSLAATQLTPVDVSGGEFGSGYFGPTSISTTKKVGIERGNFAGAHIGPEYNVTINKISGSDRELAPEQRACTKHNGNCRRLTDYICLFPHKKLSTARKSKVFGGMETSEIVADQPLAIKMVYDFTEKNCREAKNLVKLRPHTNVVTIRQAGVCSQAPMRCMYIAMERCSTENLESYIEKRRKNNIPYNIRQSVQHSKQVIEAIQHIHLNGILHRDLKPSSVLFSLSGRDLKICDFGVSKELEHGRSVISLSMLKVGTDGYRAPETYNMNEITKMADIYSLALVLHHLLSYGFHPHGSDPEGWNFNIKNGKNLSLGRLRAPFREIAKDMFGKMLKFRPEDRPKIEEVVEEFRKLDWFSSLMETFVETWNGTIKDVAGADVLSCKLLSTPSMQEVIRLDTSGWTFRMNMVQKLNIGSFKQITDEEPAGYIATSEDELKKLTTKLSKNNLMAWIDISKQGKDGKVIVLLSSRDYPELYGFFLPSPEVVSTLLGKLVTKQGKTGSGRKKASEESATLVSTDIQTQPKSVYVATETHESPNEDPIQGQLSSSTANRRKGTSTQKELIPWWILNENLRN